MVSNENKSIFFNLNFDVRVGATSKVLITDKCLHCLIGFGGHLRASSAKSIGLGPYNRLYITDATF